ncbi:MAG: shikimate dehydrogenase [Gemmatimonadales bacterium]
MTAGAFSRCRLYVLLGDPVHHSLSPAIQNAAMRAVGLDAVYVAMHAWEELVGPLMRSVAAEGGGGNVTVPHKRVAAGALDEASEAVKATGACNVFWWAEEKGLCGDNTDVEAFRTAAEAVLGSSLTGRRVLLLGAGGAARAVASACMDANAERVDVLNRTPARAESLIRDLGEPPMVRALSSPDSLPSQRYDLVVNATSLGLAAGDPLPIELGSVRAEAVLDLVYSRNGTPFVRAAREAGLKAEDGRRMLIEQAAASFRRWFDREPAREVMYGAVGLLEDDR